MKPAECAQKLISQFNMITSPAFSINSIYEHYNIICVEQKFDDYNYMGSLHRRKNETVIIINTDINNHGRINFIKAHELGHFILNHIYHKFHCTRFDLFGKTRKPMEIEANQFAREYLLPEQMVKSILLSAPFDFDTIKAITDQFLVSKLAAVFRILDFHIGNHAFIYSQHGKITHSAMSTSLLGKINIHKSEVAVNGRSFANAVLNSNARMNGYSTIDSSVWISKNLTKSKISLREYSRANKSAGTVMTLLKVDFL